MRTKEGSGYPWTSDITGGLGGVTQGQGKGGLHWCIWMSLGHREVWEEEFVAGNRPTTLVHLIVWVGSSHLVCRDTEATGKPEIQQLWHRNWTVGLKELEMIYIKRSFYAIWPEPRWNLDVIGRSQYLREMSPVVFRVFGALSRVYVCECSFPSVVWFDFATQWTIAHKTSQSMGFSRQKFRRASSPPLGDLPNPGTQPVSPALQADFLPLSHQRCPSRV